MSPVPAPAPASAPTEAEPLLPRPPTSCTKPARRARAQKYDTHALKAWYFFFFAAQITQLFLPLILSDDLGVSQRVIGLLMAARRLVVFFVAPLFTALCDATLRHYALLSLALPAYFACSAALPAMPGLRAIAGLLLVREALVAGCEPAVNAAAFAKLRARAAVTSSGADADAGKDAESRFGEVRMWGSVGWGAAGLAVPAVCDAVSPGSYVPVLYTHCAIGAAAVALVWLRCVDVSPALFRAASSPMAGEKESGVVLDDASAPRVTPRVAALAAAVLLQGVVLGAVQCTILLYLAGLGVRPLFLGLSVTTGCLSEAGLFLVHGRVRRALHGDDARGMQLGVAGSVAMLCMYAGVRLASSAGARTALALAAECVNGAFYALFVCSALSAAQAEAPPRWRTSAQGAVQAVLYGVGPALGAAAAGAGMQAFGAPAVYVALAAANVLLAGAMQACVVWTR